MTQPLGRAQLVRLISHTYKKAQQQFEAILDSLQEGGFASECGIAVIERKEMRAKIKVLGQPYELECHITKVEDEFYIAKLVLVEQGADGLRKVVHSLAIDSLGNISTDPTQAFETLSIRDCRQWLCEEWVLTEANKPFTTA